MEPRLARPDDLPAAFGLLFAHLHPGERQERVEHALGLVARGEFDPAGVFVLAAGGTLAGAVVCTTVPGRGSLLWPPVVPRRDTPDLEDALVRCACAWLRERGARLAQCLLTDEQVAIAAPLLRAGFAHITDLYYLRHPLVLDALFLGASARLVFEPYDPARPGAFHRTLEQTYAASLDCPELSGLRTVEAVIEGHQAQGKFDPARWWLVRHRGDAVGVLLLMEQPGGGDHEVVYMGVVPAARRRGFGREMLLHALCEAKAAGAAAVTLSVDGRNRPARELYRRVGFDGCDRRAVYLLVWP
jgi:ribosomal protein S18 acetylase RimI-like enzyme